MDDQVVGQNRGVEISVAHCTMYIKRGVFFLHHKILIYIYDKGHKKSREYEMWNFRYLADAKYVFNLLGIEVRNANGLH